MKLQVKQMMKALTRRDQWELPEYEADRYYYEGAEERFYPPSTSKDYIPGLLMAYIDGRKVSVEEFRKALQDCGLKTTPEDIQHYEPLK